MEDSNVDQVLDMYLQNGPSETHVRTLNKLLSTSKTSVEGWGLLKSMLNYCTGEFLNENMTTWLDHCLMKHQVEALIELKLSVIGKLLEASSSNNELSKKIASDYLSRIVDFCLMNKYNWYEVQASFDVLTVCMKKYNTSLTSQKTLIEVHVLSFLKSSDDSIVEKAAEAFLYLQQVGNAGTESINHRNNFRVSLQKLCSTAHNLFDTFLENRIEIDHINKPNQEGFIFDKPPPYDCRNILHITAGHIKNVIQFLTVMIQNNFTTHKEISPIEVLNVIRRGTMTHHCVTTSTEKSLDDYKFCLLLNDIQVQLLHLLRILILWLQNNSFPFSFIIGKILIDCLKRSQKCKCFSLNCIYQETTYTVLKCWLSTSKCALNLQFQTELIACILKDITPVKSLVTLKVKSEATKKRATKRKNTQNIFLPSSQAIKEVTKSKHEIEKDELRCQLALETLTRLYYSSFIRVDKKIIQDVYIIVTNIFNDINTSKAPHPYKNHKSQLKLHELLVSFYEQETLNTLPFIGLSLNILNTSSCSKNNDVASICKKGLNTLEQLCQPVSTPFSTFSALQVEPSNDKEQIIDEDILLMECVTENDRTEVLDPTPMRKKINVIENQIINIDPTLIKSSSSFTDQVARESSINESILEQRETFNSVNTVNTTGKNEEEEYNFSNSINVSNKTDTLQITAEEQIIANNENLAVGTVCENSMERLNEPEIEQTIKRSKIEDKNPVKTEHSSAIFEELNLFVDEIKED